MIFVNTEKFEIKSWCNNPEAGAIEQAKNLANLPFIHQHIALMPDAHMGYGCPIGTVAALDKAICVNLIGVDIGCGVYACKTTLKDITTEQLKHIMSQIRKDVPLGFNKHKIPCSENDMPETSESIKNFLITPEHYLNAQKSLGTLGGGNHFIEIQKGSDGHIWFMIHSGSRNLGKQVADYYNKLAIEQNERWFSPVPKEHQLAFLPVNHFLGQAYLKEMEFCLAFAKKNREKIAEHVLNAIKLNTDGGKIIHYDVHHNYVTIENHYGKNVWIHRKGATSAKKGEIGIIPGSQGTASYIVSGKGNKESFMSCSHGAGRTMSRTKARKELNLEEEQAKLDSKGIIHSIRGKKDLDEASSAYKDIDTVMEEQKNLVEILIKLEPLAVIKG